MIQKIDHIAIAVHNLESALETFRNVLGCAPGAIRIEEVASEKVRGAQEQPGEDDQIHGSQNPKIIEG